MNDITQNTEEVVTNEMADAIVEANQFISDMQKEVELDTTEEVTAPLNDDQLETKKVNVLIDPATGENKIIGEAAEEDTSFEDLVDQINSEEYDFEESPITEEDLKSNIEKDDALGSELSNMLKDKKDELDMETIRGLLEVLNMKNRDANVNVYKILPQAIKDEIDKYIQSSNVGQPIMIMDSSQRNMIRKSVANALIDEFADNIQLDKIKHDFARDMEKVYKSSIKDISESSLEYIAERNKAYREATEEIEDPEKKRKLLEILDVIDEARALTQLKEYAKKCKIKNVELSNVDKVFSDFNFKYANSSNNIYNIANARDVLARHIVSDEYSLRDVNAFLIAFYKQTRNYSPSVATEHAYMYYILYYCALLDGDKSETFKNNVRDVINNLKERNNWK